MMNFRWSWFFISHALLVRPGFAYHDLDGQNTDDNVPRDSTIVHMFVRSIASSNKPNNTTAIVFIVAAVVILVITIALFFFYMRRRKRAMQQIEDGVVEEGDAEKEKAQWWHIDLQSAKGTSWWVLETKPKSQSEKEEPVKKISHLQRLRNAFTGKRETEDEPPDTWPPPTRAYNSRRPSEPGQAGHVTRPVPSMPNGIPRYPSILDRPGNPPDFPPPTTPKNAHLARTILDVESRERADRRRILQVPPKALMIPNGRHVLVQPHAGILKPASRSPSGRRRSWLSRNQFKNPFLPLKDSDAILPPPSTVSAGLALRQKMTMSPKARSRALVAGPATSPPDASYMEKSRRIPPPIQEERSIHSPSLVHRAPPGTGGVPRPKYQIEERAMRSALPLGYQPRSHVHPRVI